MIHTAHAAMRAKTLFCRPDDVSTDNDFFTVEEAENIKEAMGDAVSYVGFQSSQRTDMKAGRKTSTLYLSGLAENPTALKDLKILYGRMLNDSDFQNKRNYVVLQKETAEEFFGDANAVGRTVEVKLNEDTEELLVIGVYENTDSAFMKLMSAETNW